MASQGGAISRVLCTSNQLNVKWMECSCNRCVNNQIHEVDSGPKDTAPNVNSGKQSGFKKVNMDLL
ncbi:hypothetical protein EGR_10853 [Echinococcus granulosus]|uniref:Uncharacterized protein n=1 Tax=Echinococcus granulosus TaxID=6210 RepID=W6U7E5_ECHGR|nr:hypothetical protein EGR_10853 [Echinococcus granulosus]EUB54292.1 hypothetical protein EGR_10853 [Echinococcus granulosus]